MNDTELLCRNLVDGLDELAVLHKQLSDTYSTMSTLVYHYVEKMRTYDDPTSKKIPKGSVVGEAIQKEFNKQEA